MLWGICLPSLSFCFPLIPLYLFCLCLVIGRSILTFVVVLMSGLTVILYQLLSVFVLLFLVVIVVVSNLTFIAVVPVR